MFYSSLKGTHCGGICGPTPRLLGHGTVTLSTATLPGYPVMWRRVCDTRGRKLRGMRCGLRGGWVLLLLAWALSSPAGAGSPKQHVAPLASQTIYRAAAVPFGGATNDAIDLTCALSFVTSSAWVYRSLCLWRSVIGILPLGYFAQVGPATDRRDQRPRSARSVDLEGG